MILSFSQIFPWREANYFPEKIWSGLYEYGSFHAVQALEDYLEQAPWAWNNFADMSAKIHTIREDVKNRWKVGGLIHFVINNRTKNYFQFAPVLKVASTQTIEISYSGGLFDLKVDERSLSCKEIEALAINDGFDNVEDFLKYFDKDFKGKIIHWTSTKY